MLGATVSLGEMMVLWVVFSLHSLIAYLVYLPETKASTCPAGARPRKHFKHILRTPQVLVYANNIYDAQLPFSKALMVELKVMTFGCSSLADLRSNCHTLGIFWHGRVSRPKMFNVQQPTQKLFDWNLAVRKLVRAT